MMSRPPVVHFGAFQLDRRAGELTRSGRRVHLAPQAIQLLTLLTDRAGEVVTREEIRLTLWTSDTFVDVDTAVNACVSQIRGALGDKAVAPRFVETLPRRGYRFVAPVLPAGEVAVAVTPAPEAPAPALAAPASVMIAPVAPPSWRWVAGPLVLGVLLLVALVPRSEWPASAAGIAPPAFARTRSLSAIQKLERGSSGLADASPAELLDRVKHFETAITAEPDFAEAYAGLAEARLLLAHYRAEAPSIAYPAAKAAAAKALSLDPDLGAAHAAYAAAVLQFEWDWESARVHLARAGTLAPGSARVHHWSSRYFSARGRHRDALRHAAQALALTPTSPSAWTNAGVIAFYAGDPRQARARCERAAALMPEFVPARQCLSAASAALAGQGGGSPDGLLSPAVALAASGDTAAALDWLQQAANRHSDALIFAGVQPAFAALQAEPRFISVLQRVGLRSVPQPGE